MGCRDPYRRGRYRHRENYRKRSQSTRFEIECLQVRQIRTLAISIRPRWSFGGLQNASSKSTFGVFNNRLPETTGFRRGGDGSCDDRVGAAIALQRVDSTAGISRLHRIIQFQTTARRIRHDRVLSGMTVSQFQTRIGTLASIRGGDHWRFPSLRMKLQISTAVLYRLVTASCSSTLYLPDF